jgi:phage baseplate assembly protein W
MAQPIVPTNQTVYRDFDLTFKKHPVTKGLVIRKNADAITQGIKNLILTDKYERPFKPQFGSDIRERLFDNFDPLTLEGVKHDVELAFQNYSSRAQLLNVGVGSDDDHNQLYVTITYRPVNSATVQTATLSLQALR